MSDAAQPRLRRLFGAGLARRGAGFAAVLAVTLVAGALAARVEVDPSVEHFFPIDDPVRAAYDRYQAAFPAGDAQALVIAEAPDLFAPAGLARLAALEEDLGRLPHVVDVLGPRSAKDVVRDEDGTVRLERLFRRGGRSPGEAARAAARASTDPTCAGTR